jgi:hypothetical protein
MLLHLGELRGNLKSRQGSDEGGISRHPPLGASFLDSVPIGGKRWCLYIEAVASGTMVGSSRDCFAAPWHG